MVTQPLLLTIEEAGQRLSIGRSLLLNLCYRGDIVSVKCGRRRLIPTQALEAYVAQLQAEQAGDGQDAGN